MSHITISKLIAVVFVVAAIVAPAASAYPVVEPPSNSQATHQQSQSGTPSGSNDASSGFDWSDAAIGAGAMLIVLGAGGAAVVTVRRSRERSHSLVAS